MFVIPCGWHQTWQGKRFAHGVHWGGPLISEQHRGLGPQTRSFAQGRCCSCHISPFAGWIQDGVNSRDGCSHGCSCAEQNPPPARGWICPSWSNYDSMGQDEAKTFSNPPRVAAWSPSHCTAGCRIWSLRPHCFSSTSRCLRTVFAGVNRTEIKLFMWEKQPLLRCYPRKHGCQDEGGTRKGCWQPLG